MRDITIFIGAVMLVAGLTFTCAYFEMRAFNKFSKVKATVWDAVFTELRVIPQ